MDHLRLDDTWLMDLSIYRNKQFSRRIYDQMMQTDSRLESHKKFDEHHEKNIVIHV